MRWAPIARTWALPPLPPPPPPAPPSDCLLLCSETGETDHGGYGPAEPSGWTSAPLQNAVVESDGPWPAGKQTNGTCHETRKMSTGGRLKYIHWRFSLSPPLLPHTRAHIPVRFSPGPYCSACSRLPSVSSEPPSLLR